MTLADTQLVWALDSQMREAEFQGWCQPQGRAEQFFVYLDGVGFATTSLSLILSWNVWSSVLPAREMPAKVAVAMMCFPLWLGRTVDL